MKTTPTTPHQSTPDGREQARAHELAPSPPPHTTAATVDAPAPDAPKGPAVGNAGLTGPVVPAPSAGAVMTKEAAHAWEGERDKDGNVRQHGNVDATGKPFAAGNLDAQGREVIATPGGGKTIPGTDIVVGGPTQQ